MPHRLLLLLIDKNSLKLLTLILRIFSYEFNLYYLKQLLFDLINELRVTEVN